MKRFAACVVALSVVPMVFAQEATTTRAISSVIEECCS